MLRLLAQVTLEDVFKSTQESMNSAPGSERILAMALGAAALLALLLVLQQRRRHQALPKPVNHQGKLLKEVAKSLPLKASEMKQLKQLADEQAYSSPLLLLLCPSLLAKAVQSKPPDQRKATAAMIKRMGEQ